MEDETIDSARRRDDEEPCSLRRPSCDEASLLLPVILLHMVARWSCDDGVARAVYAGNGLNYSCLGIGLLFWVSGFRS